MSWVAKASPLVLALGLAFPLSSVAIGLGEVKVESAIGEPFRARVPVIGQLEGSVDRSCVRILGGGAELPRLRHVDHSLVKLPSGSYEVRLISAQTVSEPILALALEWSCGGKVAREYAMLFNPPSPLSPPGPQGERVSPTLSQTESFPTASSVPDAAQENTAPVFRGSEWILNGAESLEDLSRSLYPDSRRYQRRFLDAVIKANPGLDPSLRAPAGTRVLVPDLRAAQVSRSSTASPPPPLAPVAPEKPAAVKAPAVADHAPPKAKKTPAPVKSKMSPGPGEASSNEPKKAASSPVLPPGDAPGWDRVVVDQGAGTALPATSSATSSASPVGVGVSSSASPVSAGNAGNLNEPVVRLESQLVVTQKKLDDLKEQIAFQEERLKKLMAEQQRAESGKLTMAAPSPVVIQRSWIDEVGMLGAMLLTGAVGGAFGLWLARRPLPGRRD